MKILQINSVCGYGSTGRIATDLYDVLVRTDNSCMIAFGRGKSPNKLSTYKIGNKLDLLLHLMKTRLTDRHGFGSKISTRKLIKKIEEYNPDIIQLHNLHGYYVNVELLFNYLSTKNIPIVWLLHDQWSFSPHAANFDVEKNEKLPKMNNYKKQKYEYPKSYFDNSQNNYNMKKKLFTSIENMTIVTPSVWLAELVEKSFLNSYPVKVIPNGIDLKKFKPSDSDFREKYKLQDKTVILGVASVWDEKKGITAFNYLAKRLDRNYQIILVGINKKDKRGIHRNIITLERTDSIEDLAKIYTSADIFLNPTLQDNFPTTNLEALACGTPVITFDTGGSPESLNGDVGKVVEKGNLMELYQTIVNFDATKKYKADCIQQSERFDKNKIYNEYISLYKKILLK